MCWASSAAGLLSHEESGTLLAALGQVEGELAEGSFVFKPGDEDVHTAIERRVTEIAPEVGGRLHTGRSRNDQVATDLRLFTKRSLGQVAKAIIALQEVLLARAREAGDAYLPGYTHLQQSPAGAAGPSPPGPRLGAGPGRRPHRRHSPAPGRVASGGGCPGRVVAAARPGLGGAGAGLFGPVRQLAGRRVRP